MVVLACTTSDGSQGTWNFHSGFGQIKHSALHNVQMIEAELGNCRNRQVGTRELLGIFNLIGLHGVLLEPDVAGRSLGDWMGCMVVYLILESQQ